MQLERFDEYLCPSLTPAFDYPGFEQLDLAASADLTLFEPDLQMPGLARLSNAASLVELQGGVEHGFIDLLFVSSQLLIEFDEPAA